MKIVHWNMLLVLLVALPEAVSEDLAAPYISVYGTATIQVTPNQMLWLLNVRNTDQTAEGVAKIHEETVTAVIAYLKTNGIAEKTIQTSRMQLGENWIFSRGERSRDGYFASTDVQFKLVELSRYSSFWIGLSAIKGVQISNISLENSDRIQYQNEARTKAVLAAREKAKAIAETLGVRLGEPLIVEEDVSAVEGYRSQIPLATNAAIAAGAPQETGQSIAPGTIPVRARIKTVFRMRK